jgi:hypothetical protein
MPHPIHVAAAQVDEEVGRDEGRRDQAHPISYEVYVEKLTASFLAKSQEYDIIWHNDDWGQLGAPSWSPSRT